MLKIILLINLVLIGFSIYTMEKEQSPSSPHLTIPVSSQEWQEVQRLIFLLNQSITAPLMQEQSINQEITSNRGTCAAESQSSIQLEQEESSSSSAHSLTGPYFPISAALERGNSGGPIISTSGYVSGTVQDDRDCSFLPLIDTEPYSTNSQNEDHPPVGDNRLAGDNISTLTIPLRTVRAPQPSPINGTFQYFIESTVHPLEVTGRIEKKDKIKPTFSICFDDHSAFLAPNATISEGADRRKQAQARMALTLKQLEEKESQERVQKLLKLNCKVIPFGNTPANLLSLVIIKLAQIDKPDELQSLPKELQDAISTFKQVLGDKRHNLLKAIDCQQFSMPLVEALIIATPVLKREVLIKQIIEKAAYNADIPLLSFFKEKGIDLSLHRSHRLGNSLLHIVCTSPSTKALESIAFLLNHKIDINGKAKDGATALRRAIEASKTSIVEYLLAHGASIQTKDVQGKTVLHHAINKGHKEIVDLLIAHGADVNAQDNNNNTPLHSLAEAFPLSEGHSTIVKCLLDHKADVTIKNRRGHTPLTLARINGGAWHSSRSTLFKIMAILKEYAKQLGQKDAEKQESLTESFLNAAETGNIEALKRLQNKVSVNSKGKQGNTALMVAARAGRTETVLYLLSQKADVSLTNVFHETVAVLARQTGQHHIAYIIENGVMKHL